MATLLNWTSGYPSTVDTISGSFPVLTDGVHFVAATHVNSLASAVVGLQNVVGGLRSAPIQSPLSLSAGQVLAWNSGTSQFEPATITTTEVGLVGDKVVDLAGLVDNDIITYDLGSDTFVREPLPAEAGNIGSVAANMAGITNGQYAVYNSGTTQFEPGSAPASSLQDAYDTGQTIAPTVADGPVTLNVGTDNVLALDVVGASVGATTSALRVTRASGVAPPVEVVLQTSGVGILVNNTASTKSLEISANIIDASSDLYIATGAAEVLGLESGGELRLEASDDGVTFTTGVTEGGQVYLRPGQFYPAFGNVIDLGTSPDRWKELHARNGFLASLVVNGTTAASPAVTIEAGPASVQPSLNIDTSGSGYSIQATRDIRPTVDNVPSLGAGDKRWSVVHAVDAQLATATATGLVTVNQLNSPTVNVTDSLLAISGTQHFTNVKDRTAFRFIERTDDITPSSYNDEWNFVVTNATRSIEQFDADADHRPGLVQVTGFGDLSEDPISVLGTQRYLQMQPRGSDVLPEFRSSEIEIAIQRPFAASWKQVGAPSGLSWSVGGQSAAGDTFFAIVAAWNEADEDWDYTFEVDSPSMTAESITIVLPVQALGDWITFRFDFQSAVARVRWAAGSGSFSTFTDAVAPSFSPSTIPVRPFFSISGPWGTYAGSTRFALDYVRVHGVRGAD